MSKLSTERAIDALDTVRAYYASLTAGYPKGKDCKGIGDVTCVEIANSCLMAIKALRQEPKTEMLDKIRAELIQSIQNGMLKIEGGNEELFRIIDKYKTESEEEE